ncbi:conserved protein, unknown function, partial [Hepatocystis sp. ex Piliocolobus tephrosceles]
MIKIKQYVSYFKDSNNVNCLFYIPYFKTPKIKYYGVLFLKNCFQRHCQYYSALKNSCIYKLDIANAAIQNKSFFHKRDRTGGNNDISKITLIKSKCHIFYNNNHLKSILQKNSFEKNKSDKNTCYNEGTAFRDVNNNNDNSDNNNTHNDNNNTHNDNNNTHNDNNNTHNDNNNTHNDN